MPEQFDPNKTPVMPLLMVDSIERALDYYTNILGFENVLGVYLNQFKALNRFPLVP